MLRFLAFQSILIENVNLLSIFTAMFIFFEITVRDIQNAIVGKPKKIL